MTTSRIETFKQMLEADPSNSMVIFGLANEYLKSEQWEEAVEALSNYLQKTDDEGAAYGMLARAYEKLGKRDEARSSYERGIQASDSHNHPSMAADYRMTLETDYTD